MISALLAASLTFTATATGLEKGAPVEFAFAGADTDRDYETMFLIDGSVGAFCARLEKAGMPRGKPEDLRSCTLWPVGCKVSLQPALDTFVETKYPEGLEPSPIVYTGGSRLADGDCEASTNMPLAVFSLYSLSQSPLVFSAHYDQSAVYNASLARKTLKKGEKVKFTLSWDADTMPKSKSYQVRPGNAPEILLAMKTDSKDAEIDALVDFAPEMTVKEAQSAAAALAVVDSRQVKINGCKKGRLFYRAFLPDAKWRNRQERLVQPFELTLGETNRLVYVESDWSVEGLDPKLTPRVIPFAEAAHHTDTDTCFIFASPDTRLAKVYEAMARLSGTRIGTWYVFSGEQP